MKFVDSALRCQQTGHRQREGSLFALSKVKDIIRFCRVSHVCIGVYEGGVQE